MLMVFLFVALLPLFPMARTFTGLSTIWQRRHNLIGKQKQSNCCELMFTVGVRKALTAFRMLL